MPTVPNQFLGGDCLSAEDLNANFQYLCDAIQKLETDGIPTGLFSGAVKYLNATNDSECVELDFGTTEAVTNSGGCVQVPFPTNFVVPPTVTVTPCVYAGNQTPVSDPRQSITINSVTAEGFNACFYDLNTGAIINNEYVCFNWTALTP